MFILANYQGLKLCAELPGHATVFKTIEHAKENTRFGGLGPLFIGEIKLTGNIIFVLRWLNGLGKWTEANNEPPNKCF